MGRSRSRSSSRTRYFSANFSHHSHGQSHHGSSPDGKYYYIAEPQPAHIHHAHPPKEHYHRPQSSGIYTLEANSVSASTNSHSSRPPYRRKKPRPTILTIGIITSILLIILIVTLTVGLTLSARSTSSPRPRDPWQDGQKVFEGTGIRVGEDVLGSGRKGECGWKMQSGEALIAVGREMFDEATKAAGGVQDLNGLCGRRVRVVRYRWENRPVGEGKEVLVEGMVAGRCAECNSTDLALPPVLFRKLADDLIDRVNITWAFL